MTNLVGIICAIIGAMIVLILINSYENNTILGESSLTIPIEEEHDSPQKD